MHFSLKKGGIIKLNPEDQWSCSSPESNILSNTKAYCTISNAFVPVISKFDAELVKKLKSLCEGQCQILAFYALKGKQPKAKCIL